MNLGRIDLVMNLYVPFNPADRTKRASTQLAHKVLDILMN